MVMTREKGDRIWMGKQGRTKQILFCHPRVAALSISNM